MDKIFLWGASVTGERALYKLGKENVIAFIDSYKAGAVFCGKPVITLEEYKKSYTEHIVICSHQYRKIIPILYSEKIDNFSLFSALYMHDDVPMATEIAHGNWPNKLEAIGNFEGKNVLEIGSRVVTGANFRKLFSKANYIGFDLYAGENVDVVGDAHRLSEYFDIKFDLIFCSAVFEHFSMPWVVSDEIIKLLKVNGYVFVETHYSYCSHERPWHFFQFSELALEVLFSRKRGIQCIEKGVSNPLIGFFSNQASEYLKGRSVSGLYCHSDFLGQKIEDVDLDWKNSLNDESIGMYPKKKDK